MNAILRHSIRSYLKRELGLLAGMADYDFMYGYIMSCFTYCQTIEELNSHLPSNYEGYKWFKLGDTYVRDLREFKDEFFKLYYFYKGLKLL